MPPAAPTETVGAGTDRAAASAAIPPPPPDWGALVTAVDAASGGVRWSTDLEAEGVLAGSGYPVDAAYVDGGVVVSHVRYWPVLYPDGGTVRLDPATGAIVDRHDLLATVLGDLAVVDGDLTFERVRARGSAVDVSVPWRYEAVAYSGPDPMPLGLQVAPTFAIAGDRVLWSFRDTAMGFSPACPPEPGGTEHGDYDTLELGFGPDSTVTLTLAGHTLDDLHHPVTTPRQRCQERPTGGPAWLAASYSDPPVRGWWRP